jgi:RNA-directed DNA polymerase
MTTMSVPPGMLTSPAPPVPAWPAKSSTTHPDTRLQEGQYESSVPTVADRVAQTVVANYISKRAEPRFCPDSYGYRPAKSALDAVAACRQRCWKHDWVIDLDVQKFFDTVRWDLVLKALEAVTTTPWVLLYVKRWLAAPLQLPGGSLQQRGKGTPHGSAVSPVLANLFMHYALKAPG